MGWRWLCRHLPRPRALLRHPGRLLGITLLLVMIAFIVGMIGRYGWALYHFRAGRSAEERDYNGEALVHLRACLRVWPHDGGVLLLLARTYRRVGDFERARYYLNEYQRVCGPTPGLALERVLQGAAEGEVDPVKKYCLDLVQQESPASGLILEALVQGCLRTHRFPEAFGLLKDWLERQPDNRRALLFQAGLYNQVRRQGEAVTAYQRLLQLDPEHETARLQLAMVLLEDRKDAEALPHLERLWQQHPDNGQVTVLLARCRDQLGQQEEAEQLLVAVLEQAPHFTPALAARGRLALRKGEWNIAEACLREVVALEPGDHTSRYNLAQCLLRNNKLDEAKEQSQQLLRLESDMKRLNEIVTKEIGQKPRDPSMHQDFARILMSLGQVEEALRWLHKALQVDPHYVPAHQMLAEYYQRIGDRERATHHRRFLSTQPGMPARAKP